MCNKIVKSAIERARGCFLKGNEPEPIVLEIVVAPCECKEKMWAKVPNGYMWVEAEEYEGRDVKGWERQDFVDGIEKLTDKKQEVK